MERILFDIDRTLLDIRSFFTEFFYPQTAEYLNVTPQRLAECMSRYQQTLESSTDFDADDFLEVVEDELGGDTNQLRTLFYQPAGFEAALFPETVHTLQVLSDFGFSLGIFSEGLINYQLKKLELSGITRFFEQKNTYIMRRKILPESYHQLPTEAWVIDDNLMVIETLFQAGRQQLIWLNRDQALVGDRTSSQPKPERQTEIVLDSSIKIITQLNQVIAHVTTDYSPPNKS